jgi:DNA-binding NarL/FixJ family response regulator
MKTLIVEDNTALREHAERLIRERLPQALPAAAVADGSEALTVARRARPELLLLDIQLPGRNGIEVAREVWRERPELRIVFWSQFKDEIYVRRLAQIVPPETVYGFVLKTSPDEKLVQALRTVLVDEQCWLDREIRGVQVRATHGPAALTDAEYEALIDIALGLTDRGIARRRYLSRRGAQNRLHSLYMRLGVEREEEPGSMYSPRNRAVFEGLRRGLVNAEVLADENAALARWLEENGDG